MDKKIIQNFIYNIIYQILVLLLPFITMPYISRIFSPDQIGAYSITYSVVQLFIIFGMFAIGSYGAREIALYRDNKVKLSEKYNEIRFLQNVMIIISSTFYYLIYIHGNVGEMRYLYYLQGINLIACLFDISWLYIGVENFKKTITRNLIVKLMSLILIFMLIKNNSDLNKYILIIGISTLMGNLSMWISKGELINKCKVNKFYFIKNFKSAFTLFIPQLFFQIYTSFDRSILGLVSTVDQVGLYDQSQKLIRMSVGIVTALGIVMLPRISNMISSKASESEINEILTKSLDLTLFISIAITCGIYSISENFVPWFFGETYLGVIKLIKISSVVCLLTALGSFFSNQYAIPRNNKKAYMYPLILAGIVSIILNLILGSKYGAMGGCITIVVVEIIALILRMYYLKNDLNYKMLFKNSFLFIIAGVIMILTIKILTIVLKLNPSIISTMIEVIIGASVYCITLIMLRSEYRDMLKKLIIRKERVS